MPTRHWSPSRRHFLKAVGAGTVAVSLPAEAKISPPPPLNAYKPVFFNQEEWDFILAACARLIPSEGEGPGALETRVPVFIDLQMAGDFGKAADWYMDGPHYPDAKLDRGFQSPLSPAEIYRESISYINQWCEQHESNKFALLSEDIQDRVLTSCQTNEIGLKSELKEFFSLLLQNTKEGYFADPMYGGNYGLAAWKHIGFPGARAAFTEWVDQHNVPYPLGPVSISGERG